MKLYCMCQITGDVPKAAKDTQGFGPPDNQVFMAPNRFGLFENGDSVENFRPVLLRKWMTCLKQGVCQKVTDKPVLNMWAKTKDEAQTDITKLKAAQGHHPSVDLYRCPVCGAMVCVE